MLVDFRLSNVPKACRTVVFKVLPAGLLALFFASIASADTINYRLLHMNIGVEAGMEYTDNLNNSPTKVSNIYWVLGPYLEGGLEFPLHIVGSEGETAFISTGFSYNQKFSLSGNKNQQTFSSPVVVSINVPWRIGDWRFSLTEGLTFKDEPLETAVAVNDQTFSTFDNTVSLNANRNFGKAVISSEVRRRDTFSPDEPTLDVTTYELSVTPGWQLRENYLLFWRNTYGITYQNNDRLQDSEGWSSEVGVSGQLTPQMAGSISMGYSHSHLKRQELGPGDGIFGGIFDPDVLKPDNVDGISSQLALAYSHPLRPNTSYSMTMYHSPGVSALLKDSSVTDVYGVTLSITHRLRSNLTLTPVFQWTHLQDMGRQPVGTPHEKTDLFSVNLLLNRNFAPNLAGQLEYRFQARSSNILNGTYDVNQVNIKLRYLF